MAVTVYPDLVQSCGGVHHIQSGWAITRVFIVDGLTTLTSWNTGSFLTAAVTAVEGVTGARGSACPDISVPTYLEQLVPEVISDRACRVRVIYKGFPAAIVEIRGIQNTVESNLDINGNLILTSYTYPKTYTLDPRKAGKRIFQGGFVTKELPEAVAIIRWIQGTGTILGVPHTGLGMMTHYADAWQGTLNDTTYTIGDYLVGSPGCWKISDVSGVSRDGGLTYEAHMEFQLRPDGWDPLVVFINPDTGKPPQDNGAPGDVVSYRPLMYNRVTFPTITLQPN